MVVVVVVGGGNVVGAAVVVVAAVVAIAVARVGVCAARASIAKGAVLTAVQGNSPDRFGPLLSLLDPTTILDDLETGRDELGGTCCHPGGRLRRSRSTSMASPDPPASPARQPTRASDTTSNRARIFIQPS